MSKYKKFRDDHGMSKDEFIITKNHPRILPEAYEKGALDICIMSCSRPELLTRTLSSLTEWFKACNNYPIEKISLNVWENSDNQECKAIAKKYISSMGVKGRFNSWNRNIGIYSALRNVWNMGNAEFIWMIEDDWYVGSRCNLIQDYIDVFNYDQLVDAIFIQYPHLSSCKYSKEIISPNANIQYRYVTNFTGCYGKWATPIVFRRDILDTFVNNLIPAPAFNHEGEAFLCSLLNTQINTAVPEYTGHFPLIHIGKGSTVHKPIEPPIGEEMIIYTLPHLRGE